MLYFVDESFRTVSGRQCGALGGVAIPKPAYNRVCSGLYKIKMDEFGSEELDHDEVKASRVFSKATFRAEASGGRLDFSFHTAARRFFDLLSGAGARTFVVATTDVAGLSIRSTGKAVLPDPYARMLRMFAAHIDTSSRRLGHLIMDQVGHRQDLVAANAVQNYIVRARPELRRSLLQVPSHTHSAVSPGLQAADLVAYLGAGRAGPEDRAELAPWWDVVKDFATPDSIHVFAEDTP